MNYCNLDANKEHVIILLRWLVEEVLSAGGDGDGIWYSKYFDVAAIEKLIEDENLLPKFWKMTISKDSDSLSLGDNQEWLTITNIESEFTSRPVWQQVSLVW
jgi:hypothetical protein